MEIAFGEIWYWFIVMAVVSYFVGCFNFALLISKIKHKDVRKMGSGNPGTMNMSRQFGLKIGALTLFCDMVKGGLPLLIAHLIFRGCLCGHGRACRGLGAVRMRRVGDHRAYLSRHDALQRREGDRFDVGDVFVCALL